MSRALAAICQDYKLFSFVGMEVYRLAPKMPRQVPWPTSSKSGAQLYMNVIYSNNGGPLNQPSRGISAAKGVMLSSTSYREVASRFTPARVPLAAS